MSVSLGELPHIELCSQMPLPSPHIILALIVLLIGHIFFNGVVVIQSPNLLQLVVDISETRLGSQGFNFLEFYF